MAIVEIHTAEPSVSLVRSVDTDNYGALIDKKDVALFFDEILDAVREAEREAAREWEEDDPEEIPFALELY